MRRLSVFLAFAAIFISLVVIYTYSKRRETRSKSAEKRPEQLGLKYDASAAAWHWGKDDPQTNKPVVRAEAKSFRAVHEPSTFELEDMALRLFNKEAKTYTYVQSGKAQFDTSTGEMKSQGAVYIVMAVPAGKEPDDQQELPRLTRVYTSDVTYQTKSGKATTDSAANFKFESGDGKSVGVDYDPATGRMHMHSKVLMNMVGNGPPENAMHVESGDLVYVEKEGKIFLSPWSKLKRGPTTVVGKASVVSLQDGVLEQIVTDHAVGTDVREGRRLTYSADQLTAHFNEEGVLADILGENHARIVSDQPAAKTTVTSQRANLMFDIQEADKDGKKSKESLLREVLADNHAVLEAVPVARPNVQLAETKILRSEHLQLEMKPGGQEIQTIHTPGPGQVEFKPNRPDQAHRVLDAGRLIITYGPDNQIETFHGWQTATRTDRPKQIKNSAVKTGQSPATSTALTWSDELLAKFAPGGTEMSALEQTGNFRYREGARHARSKKALLEQDVNRITLVDRARVWDDTGSTNGDTIVMDQQSGDMNVTGHVTTTRQPDSSKSGAQGSALLDNTQILLAMAEKMATRGSNQQIHYEGHAVLWQGANRLAADIVDIDREEQTLHAQGNVINQLVDNTEDKKNASPNKPDLSAAPIFTLVRAPDLLYRDDERLAYYTGGAHLVRDKLVMDSRELRAYLNEASNEPGKSDDSSLNHAFADGDVKITQATTERTRTGTSQHAEYYPKENKVILNTGLPQMVDSRKGITKGQQLTYFSNDDRLIVEGKKEDTAFTRMKKK